MQEFNSEYETEQCKKCNGHAGWHTEYNHPTDRLIIICKRCGYTYDMEPRIPKTDRKKVLKERKGHC